MKAHRVPAWWLDAKLGIFIHWTPASVIGWAPTDVEIGDVLGSTDPAAMANTPYTEWYENSLRFPDSPASRHHREVWDGRPYADLGPMFDAALAGWDPEAWAARFAAAGARYVVLVAKHHDGYCLWPSEVGNPHRPGWHTSRDVVGELAEAVRAAGMKFGVYYSGGLDWTFDDRPLGSIADVVQAVPGGPYVDYAEAQVRELIDRYRPSVLWNDIAWPVGGERLWRLFADYYDAVPDGVVNDRWMPRTALWEALRLGPVRSLLIAQSARSARSEKGLVPPPPPHYDVRTPEYTVFDDVQRRPWECVRGIDRSFGFNRNSDPDHFLAREELLASVADITAKGGNLLLNVGPRGEDATIPDEQLLRLDWLGAWLDVAGPAVHATRPWVRPVARAAEGNELRFTARADAVHTLVLGDLPGALTIPGLRPGPGGEVRLLTAGGEAGEPLAWQPTGGGIRVDLDGHAGAAAQAPGPSALVVTRAEALPLR